MTATGLDADGDSQPHWLGSDPEERRRRAGAEQDEQGAVNAHMFPA